MDSFWAYSQSTGNYSNEMKLDYRTNYADFGVNAVERQGDHEDSPYFYHADFYNADETILSPEEIKAFNEDTSIASGMMVMDLRTVKDTFGGKARNEAVRSSATADAEYYFGWTYGSDSKKAE